MKKIKLSLLVSGEEKCFLEGCTAQDKNELNGIEWFAEMHQDARPYSIMKTSKGLDEIYKQLSEVVKKHYPSKNYEIKMEVKKLK